ncbi:ParB/RepB/Spo0J family partition protein [Paraburkholderia aspalathi]|uniref:ParB/RepB/Spo0J family partition protein n=1 Tax=Paraburkholderia aspalathi TaxID=1324617 RepID=UPI0038BDC90F
MEVVEIRVTESVHEANFGNEAQIEYVPYERLCRSPLNVRKKAPTGIEALAGTIVGNGLIQNLVVHPVKGSRAKQPKLGVCAGQRRLAALDLLFSQGKITKDFKVPVLIVSEGESVAASLIENRERETMHIADECGAFRLLTEEGKSIAHISALFKVSEMVVRRALRIANLSPVLLDLLRDDKLDYEQAKVLALADDHATQERVWNEAPNAWQRRPSELRAALTKAELDASENPLAKFVGLDAYESAGGYVRRDLFSDDQNAGYIADADLLHRLATDRLIEVSQTVQSEGWSWVETRTRGDANELIRHGRVHSNTRKLKKDEKAELAALVAQRDAAHMELNAYYDEDGEEDEARHDRLNTAVDVATHAVDQYAERFEVFAPEDMQRAGAFVYLDDDGVVTIERGLIRPEDRVAARGDDAMPVTATGQSSKPARVTPREHVSPQAAAEVQGMKKDAAAAAAEVRMAESGWLPEVLTNRAVPEFRSYAWADDDGEADDEAHNAGDDEGLAEAA